MGKHKKRRNKRKQVNEQQFQMANRLPAQTNQPDAPAVSRHLLKQPWFWTAVLFFIALGFPIVVPNADRPAVVYFGWFLGALAATFFLVGLWQQLRLPRWAKTLLMLTGACMFLWVAEILGFIHNHHNRSVLTPTGRNLIDHPARRSEFLADAVLKSRLMQRALPFFEANRKNGVRRQELTNFIREVTEPVGESMIPRRVSTVVSWLSSIGMVRERDGRYFLRGHLPLGVNVVEYEAPEEPLFPKKYDLDEYNGVAGSVRSAKGMLTVFIDDATKERAEKAHQNLIDLAAAKIRAAGAIPKNNPYVDLSAAFENDFFLFEMKSTTDGNVHSQVRKAISQLYEYRYMQQSPAAKLVIVIENPPPKEKQWLVDYVVKDRQLLIAWDGDGKTLQSPVGMCKELDFLM